MIQSLLQELVRLARRSAVPLPELNRAVRRQYILTVLAEQKYNGCGAARALAVHRNTFSRICGNLDINVTELRKQARIRKRPAAAVLHSDLTDRAYRGA